MNIVQSVLQEELESAREKEVFYKNKLDEFFKGSISVKKISGKAYYYLIYREGDKVKTSYLGKADEVSNKIEEYRRKIRERAVTKKNLQIVRQEIRYLKRLLNVRAK